MADHMFPTEQTFKLENYLSNSVSAVVRKINIKYRIKDVIKNVFYVASSLVCINELSQVK